MDKAIRDFLIEIEVRKYTPKTIRSYRNNLSLFLRFCEEKVGIEDTEDLSLPVVKQFAQFMRDAGRKGTYL
jgi:integrase/recombinase XerD